MFTVYCTCGAQRQVVQTLGVEGVALYLQECPECESLTVKDKVVDELGVMTGALEDFDSVMSIVDDAQNALCQVTDKVNLFEEQAKDIRGELRDALIKVVKLIKERG